MQREKLYRLQRAGYFIRVLFMLKNLQILYDRFSQQRKLVAQSFAFFGNKKYTIRMNFSL